VGTNLSEPTKNVREIGMRNKSIRIVEP
jgi:hypothetical protein